MPDTAHRTPDRRWETATIEGLDALLAALDAGETIRGDSAHHQAMHAASQEALRLTAELNGTYRSPEEVVELMSALTGRQVPASFRMFPPFTADFGRNIRFGERVFLNSGCRFQDQGGIDIGDDALIGHNAVITTLNQPRPQPGASRRHASSPSAHRTQRVAGCERDRPARSHHRRRRCRRRWIRRDQGCRPQ